MFNLLTVRIVYYNLTRGLPMKIMLAQTVFTFFFVLPLICINLPHSIYYRTGDKRRNDFLVRNTEEDRVAAANAYFGLHKTPFSYEGIDQGPRLAIGVLAVGRHRGEIDAYKPHYLSQTIHSLLTAVDREKKHFTSRFGSLHVSVCNVDHVPNNFSEATRVGQFVDHLVRGSSQKSKQPHQCLVLKDFQWCYESLVNKFPKSDWLVVLEDDQLARHDLLEVIYDIVQNKLSRRFGDQVFKKLGYIQLHSPQHLLRYSVFDASSWLEVMLLCALIAGTQYCVYYRIFIHPMRPLTNITVYGFLFCYSLCVVLAVGRPHWLSLRHTATRIYTMDSYVTEDFSAVLFPAYNSNMMSEILSQNSCVSDKGTVLNKMLTAQHKRSTPSTRVCFVT